MQLVKLLLNMPRLMLAEPAQEVPIIFLLKSRVVRIRQQQTDTKSVDPAKADADKNAEAKRLAEADKAAEAKRQAEADKKAAEAKRQAEADKRLQKRRQAEADKKG